MGAQTPPPLWLKIIVGPKWGHWPPSPTKNNFSGFFLFGVAEARLPEEQKAQAHLGLFCRKEKYFPAMTESHRVYIGTE
jgi:hypothetical protein